MSHDKIEITEIKRLNLGASDTLVVKVAGCITAEKAERVRRGFIEAVPSLDGRVIVIDDSINLAVIDAV